MTCENGCRLPLHWQGRNESFSGIWSHVGVLCTSRIAEQHPPLQQTVTTDCSIQRAS